MFKFLAFVFNWIVPFAVVYVNHVVFTETKVDVDMFGLLIVLAIIFAGIRRIDKKIELWEIHKEHKVFILNWRSGKKVLMIAILTWVLFTVEDNLGKMQLTSILILSSMVIGWVFAILSKKK